MSIEFHREYLVQLPLPLAQLYSRAYNAKTPQSRHDNTFFLFEALVKLTAAPLVAAYLHELRHGGRRVEEIDHLLMQLALPSLGQWVGMVRELARYFGERADATRHPLGHLWEQLSHRHREKPGLLGLYQRIKNGPDGDWAGDQSCTVLQVFEAIVQYRNAVIGHGAGRPASFYEQDMGPLLFPAVNELLAADTFSPLGPRGTRLVYLAELRAISEATLEISLLDLVGREGERATPVPVDREEAKTLIPNCVAVLWPGQPQPLRLDPLLVYRETETGAEVLFLNRDRNARQVEYLGYTSGRTERDETMAPAIARLLSLIAGRTITAGELAALGAQSVAETPSMEALGEPQPEPVHQLGDYEILAEIGRGGMGVVYLARQLSLGRIVALKMLPNDLTHDPVTLARFQREMCALARCDHPHIIKVLTSGTMPDGRLFYTMEYVPGSDLEQVWRELAGQTGQDSATRLSNSSFTRAVLSASGKRRQEVEARYAVGARAGTSGSSAQATRSNPDSTPGASQPAEPMQLLPLPPLPSLPSVEDDPGGYVRHVVTLIRDAALALQAVHDQHIIHRDVKPANLMLTPDGTRLVLMDFGLAKGEETTLAASRQDGLLGTVRYAAPEQLAAANLKVGPAADVRGLGVILWELLTRRQLFADAQDEKQLAMMIHELDVPQLRTIDPSFDRDLEAIVARATERRIVDRIPTAGQLAEYLQRYLDGRPLPIRPPSRAELLRRWVHRRRSAVVVGCAGFLLLLTIGGGLWYWNEYYRLHVHYYANFIERWGAPEGIGQITRNAQKQRLVTFRFTQHGRRGPVQKIEAVDYDGNPSTSHEVETHLGGFDLRDPNTWNRQKEVRWEFERTKEQITKERAFDHAGRLAYEFLYTAPNVAYYVYTTPASSTLSPSPIGAVTSMLEQTMAGLGGSLEGMPQARTRSGATHVHFVRPAEGPHVGLERELAFTDRDGNPAPNTWGIYRVKREFDARGLIVRETYHDANGDAMQLVDNYARVDRKYDPQGNLVQETYFDEQGRLTRHKQGYVRITLTFDPWGNPVEAVFFDEAGNPTVTAEGFARVRHEYDMRNRSIITTYFDEHNLPTQAKNGVARVRIQYDARGNLIALAFFDEQGQPTRSKDGYAGWSAQYDTRGNRTAVTFFDEQGQPTRDNANGVARWIA
jgi:serine/threonine protein kinase